MSENYESEGGIPFRIRLRNWLLMKLSGHSAVILNCRFDLPERDSAPFHLESSGALIANCDFSEVVRALPTGTALRLRAVKDEI